MRWGTKNKALFQKTVWDFYAAHKRDGLPWRIKTDPYRVWVSEVMLQQTQVDRVIPFFKNWMKQFPSIKSLAQASQVDVLRAWKGLGYNSRALRMKKTAEIIATNYKGIFPKSYDALISLPGIGPYTAGAIMAFAYNEPVTMIETNIRRVFIHHQPHPVSSRKPPSPLRGEGPNKRVLENTLNSRKSGSPYQGELSRLCETEGSIHDRDLLKLISQTVPHENPREWYWALMDYGSYLGKTIPNPNKKSRHYSVQKKFKGSDREIRGKILEILLLKKKLPVEKLFEALKNLSDDTERLEIIIERLEQESFLGFKNGNVFIRQ